MVPLVSAERLASGQDFQEFLAAAQKNADLWKAVYRTATVSEELVQRAARIPGRWHLVALSEDWCGDAVNTLPVLARLTERVPNITLTVFGRDSNPDLMDSHLTGTARAIPVVIVLDDELVEHGWWGPRPKALQEWFVSVGVGLEKTERYKQIRTWQARDRGGTTLDEILAIVEAGALAVETARTPSTSLAATE